IHLCYSLSPECLLCKIGWTSFSDSCYFFSNVYLTWEQSRRFCQNKSADLVVVDNLQEQTFIQNHINTRAWLGLQRNGSDWYWIDGRNDTLG
uniref:C-type lectin domain-containing protein n=1 Tax=Poecilia reticulata TaxID=8081 RepID=A0A3P9PU08_POERE